MGTWFKQHHIHSALKLKDPDDKFAPKYVIRPSLVSMILLATLAFTALPFLACAQTEFDIQADSADLKSEFQKELDKWMLRAYEGDRDAQFKVGVLFANDQFGPPDHEQSAYWYRQAARQGHPLAQYNLGHQFLMGNGVKRDEEAAMQWWLKAAEQQHALAQFNIGRAYYLGIGLKKDLNQARFWFERASQNNEPKSTELLKQLGWWSSELENESDQQVSSTIPPNTLQNSSSSNTWGLASKIKPVEESNDTASTRPQHSDETATNIESDTSVQRGKWLTTQSANTGLIVEEQATVESNKNVKKTTVNTANNPQEQDTIDPSLSISVFTNPAVRSVLITILEDARNLKTLKKGDRWTMVTSAGGLPVWVSRNFIRANGKEGVITATSVNARSVPLITQGSVVGRFNRGEKVEILDVKDGWYRVYSPERFRAWVRTEDLDKAQRFITEKPPASSRVVSGFAEKQTNNEVATFNKNATTDAESQSTNLKNVRIGSGQAIDDNEWLFSQNRDHYTLQLASFSDTAAVNRFLDTLSFKDSRHLRLYNSRSNDDVLWTYITYGAYTEKELAKNESQRLGQGRAWIRRLGVLQDKRCLAWKKQVPAPDELNKFCI